VTKQDVLRQKGTTLPPGSYNFPEAYQPAGFSRRIGRSGAAEVCGERVFWKIDLYDKDCTYGAQEPTNLETTRRVLNDHVPERILKINQCGDFLVVALFDWRRLNLRISQPSKCR